MVAWGLRHYPDTMRGDLEIPLEETLTEHLQKKKQTLTLGKWLAYRTGGETFFTQKYGFYCLSPNRIGKLTGIASF